MDYHFNIKEQLQNIINNCKLSDFDREPTATEGELYKKILASNDGHLFKKYYRWGSYF